MKRWIVGICMLVWAGRLLAMHTFNIEGKEQDIVLVDRIYEQYTRAEISMVNTEGNFFPQAKLYDIKQREMSIPHGGNLYILTGKCGSSGFTVSMSSKGAAYVYQKLGEI